RDFMPKVMIEITMDEQVIIKPQKKRIIHGYEEDVKQEIFVYSLEEIVAEKMRALLQHLKKLEERGWSRSRARDYYDLWKIFDHYKKTLKKDEIPALFLEKCKVKKIDFSGPESLFNDVMLDYVKKTWQQWMGPLVPDLPEFEVVIKDLRKNILGLFAPNPAM
ncbi:MAG: hypothetical protein COY53_02970, partial [Elusimicrobia bacterium CG_4_10_14_0_8_um_filter_37_32]